LSKRKLFNSLILILVLSFITGCSLKKDGNVIDEESVSDGEYIIDVGLDGGDGTARIKTPMNVVVSKGEMYMRIEWNDSKFVTMIVDSTKYEKVNESMGIEGNSVFIIPIDEIPHSLKVVAETYPKSMDNDYKILFNLGSFRELEDKNDDSKVGESSTKENGDKPEQEEEELVEKPVEEPAETSPVIVDTILPEYADGFMAEIYDNGSVVIRLSDGCVYLLIDEDAEIPDEFAEYIVIRSQDFICVPEKSGMDFVRKLEAGDRVLEDLEGANILGLTVIANYADDESTLFARMEWIKYYGLLLGKYDEAKNFYDGEMNRLAELNQIRSDKNRSVRFIGVSDEVIAERIAEFSGGVFLNDFESADADILIYADADEYKETKANKNKAVFHIDENELNNPTNFGDIAADLIKILDDPKVDESELLIIERIDKSAINTKELSDNSEKK